MSKEEIFEYLSNSLRIDISEGYSDYPDSRNIDISLELLDPVTGDFRVISTVWLHL